MDNYSIKALIYSVQHSPGSLRLCLGIGANHQIGRKFCCLMQDFQFILFRDGVYRAYIEKSFYFVLQAQGDYVFCSVYIDIV